MEGKQTIIQTGMGIPVLGQDLTTKELEVKKVNPAALRSGMPMSEIPI